MTTTDAVLAVLDALVEPFVAPEGRTWWPALAVAAAVALGREARRAPGPGLWRRALGVAAWRTASARLDLQLLAVRQLLRLLGPLRVGSATGLGVGLVVALDGVVGRPTPPELPAWVVAALYSVAVFVVGDWSRFVVHRAAHRYACLWALHKVHHSAEVLTPVSFHRLHPVESFILHLRGVVVTGTLGGLAYWLWRGDATLWSIAGVEAFGFILNVAVGNLRHSHVWLRFPPPVERWLLSPAQHQLHHSARPAEREANYGTWLAAWDRLGGSWRPAGSAPPSAFGLPERHRNHEQELWSALVHPLAAAWRELAPRTLPFAAAGALLAPAGARASEGGEDDEPDGIEEIVITTERGLPVAGGAAHEVDEETLERFEQDDVHDVLARVPGVYVRDEEGFGLRPNIGLRGASSDRSAKVTLLEDGVPLSPAPYAAPAAYYFPLTTRLVGVEVFKGAASIAHGPQTIGGAVNVLTRRVPDGAGGAVDVAGASYGGLKAHAWGGVGGDRAGFVLEAAHLGSEGFKELDGGGPTGFDRQDLMLKARLSLPGGGRSELEAKLGWGHEHSYETYLGLTAADFADDPYRRYAASALDELRWRHAQASLGWRYETGGRFVIHTVAYHHWLDRAWRKLSGFAGGPDLHDLLLDPDAGQAATYVAILRGEEDTATADQVLRVGTNDRQFHNYGLTSTARLWAGGERVSNLAELGVRLHADRVTRRHTEDPYQMLSGVLVPTGGGTETTLDSVSTAYALAAYARDTLRVGALSVVPGVRVEHVRTAAGTSATGPTDPQVRTLALPGLAVSTQPAPWLVGFAGLHRGFSPVAPGAAADERPETAWNGEAGVRLAPGSTYADLAGYGSHYDNVQGTCTLSAGCRDAAVDRPYNGGEAWVAGIEGALAHQVLLPRDATLDARAAYTWTWSAFQTAFVSDFPLWGPVEAGDRLPYVPEHQGFVEVVLATRKAGLGLTGGLRGAMRDVAGQGPIPEADRIPPTATFDVSADWRLTGEVRVYGLVRNLTGAAAVVSLRPYGARPDAPRVVMVGVKVTPAGAPDG